MPGPLLFPNRRFLLAQTLTSIGGAVMPRAKAGLLFTLVAILAGCRGDSLHSAATTHPSWRIDPVPLMVAGEVKGPPEYLFGSISSVVLAPYGRVVVGDRTNLTVRIFDAGGQFLRELGRAGEGPGEFRDVAGVWLTSQETVNVLDLRLRRITRFSIDGDDLSITETEIARPMHPDHYLGTFSDGSFLVGSGGWFTDEVDPNVFPAGLSFWRIGAEGQYLGTILGLIGRWWYTPTAGARRPDIPPGAPAGGTHALSPNPTIAIHGDSIYFLDQITPAVNVLLKDGELARSIPVPHSNLAEADARALLRQALAKRGDERGLSRLETMPRLSRVPQIFGLLVDDRGLIWTRAYDPRRDHCCTYGFNRRQAQGGEWQILDRAGGTLARIHLPDDFLPAQVRDSLIVGIVVDEYDVERIAVYRIRDRS
jgi:hypothetical protein